MKRSVAIILLLVTMLICVKNTPISASAEEVEYFIICQPDSFVWVRERPKKASEETGYLMLGDRVRSDGRRKNGFVHVLGITEAGEGWVHSGFVIEDEPEVAEIQATVKSRGRVACRRSVDGTRRKWLRNGDQVTVYAWGAEWCLTDEGFIKSRYLLAETNTETEKQR